MSDVTHNLLTQYYGVGVQSTGKNLTLYECMYDSEDNSEELPTKLSSVIDPNEDNVSKQTDNAEGNVDSEKRNSIYDKYVRSSRVLEIDSSDDEDESSKSLVGGFLEPNVEYDNFENSNTLSEKNSSPDKTLLDPAEHGANSSRTLNIIEETLQDNVSDISSVVSKKKIRKSAKAFTISLPPPPKKNTVCNETFMDMTNARLTEFPLESLDKFSTLRMIYLENNALTELPENLFITLKSLEWLDVRNNQITVIPLTIKFHPCLETMLLQGNKINTLPIELCTLPKLRNIQIANNPLTTPPEGIVAAGSNSILKFLRAEWNKQHPDEAIEAVEEIQPKPSTILCYRSPRRKSKAKMKELSRPKDSKASVRERGRLYKPSNRCDNSRESIAENERLFWISKVKELFNKQTSAIQKLKDTSTLKTWRYDRRSFKASMGKAAKRDKDDVPFAIEMADYGILSRLKLVKRSDESRKRKSGFVPPTDINKRINELLEHLKNVQMASPSDAKTPRSKQMLIRKEIEKVLLLQSEVGDLRRYNDVTMALAK